MALSREKYVVTNLMRKIRVTKVSYLISGHNLVTRYIMELNPDGTSSVRLTPPIRMVTITYLANEVVA